MVHKFDSMIGDCAAGSQEHAKKGPLQQLLVLEGVGSKLEVRPRKSMPIGMSHQIHFSMSILLPLQIFVNFN